MLGYLILLFITVPLVEMVILIEVGSRIGTLPTIFIVVITGIIGAALARSEGVGVIRRIYRETSQGILPADALMDGLIILIAGCLLITPGLLTDAAGFMFLVPSIRILIKEWSFNKIKDKIKGDHIEVYYDSDNQ